jgi:ribonucleotide monophosphatase NagD (HAD superfamily)
MASLSSRDLYNSRSNILKNKIKSMTIQKTIRQIGVEAEKLKLALQLPYRESIMLLDEETEARGSDYPENILNMPVIDECPACNNTGWAWVMVGDEPERDVCGCINAEIMMWKVERGQHKNQSVLI